MSKRSNQEWILALRGELGLVRLEIAHQDLANYLYKVAVNYLERRQGLANPLILASFTLEQLEGWAEDFMQETLEKLVADHCALLEKYLGKSSFTYWMSVVITNLIRDELRRAEWDRRVPPPSSQQQDDEESSSFFERIVLYPAGLEDRELSEGMLDCLQQLTESRRVAILSRMVDEHPVDQVAKAMNKSEGAVYSLVSQARRDLRKCLENK